MAQQTYSISGMHCGACVKRLESVLAPLADRVTVTLKPPQAVLEGTKPIPFEQVKQAVESAGNYTASEEQPAPVSASMPEEPKDSYYPLGVLVAYILLVASLVSSDLHGWMNAIMAGFFLTFSAFKFLNLKGFADAYSTYDLLAKRWHGYGFMYPFLELGLGISYLTGFAPFATNLFTVLLMGFSSLGVITALRKKQQIRCACLGTTLNLPMSTVTLVEDLTMVLMAGWMLIG